MTIHRVQFHEVDKESLKFNSHSKIGETITIPRNTELHKVLLDQKSETVVLFPENDEESYSLTFFQRFNPSSIHVSI